MTSSPLVNGSDGTSGTLTSFYDMLDTNASSSGSDGIQLCPVADFNSTDFYDTAQMVTGLFIYPAFCFPGLVGNILTVVVLSQRNMLTSTNAFLSALAVSDSIKLINDILYFFVTLFLNIDPVLGNLSYGYLYPYAHFIFSMSVCVSSWLTVSVAVERYILVCHPTRARNLWSRNRAVTLCTLIYVIMTSLALPSAFRYRTIRCFDESLNATRLDVELTEMWQNELFVTSYTWAQNLLRSIIPLVVLVTLNACIIRALRRTKVKKRKNSRHRVTIMMIVVILTFLICITPDAILSTVFGIGYHEAGEITKGVREITDTLLTINAAVNFIIYCALNQVFRKSFAHLCCPRRQTDGGWVTEMDESVYRRLSEAKTSILSNNHPASPKPETFSPTGDPDNGLLPSTPKSLTTTDGNENRYVSLSSNPSSPISPGFSSEGYALLPSSPNPTKDIIITTPTFHSKLSNSQPRNLHYHNNWSHPHKGSSHGLKRSRNSVKCNRGKRAGNEKNLEIQNETVTYIPTEDFESNVRRGSGRHRFPLKINGHCESDNDSDKVGLDLTSDNKLKNTKSLPLSNSCPSSSPTNNNSPATTDSDVNLDDRLQSDVTSQSDDVTLTTPISTSNCDVSNKPCNDVGLQNGDGDVNESYEKMPVISSPCNEQDLKEHSSITNELDITSNHNKVKKRALTVSFSDC